MKTLSLLTLAVALTLTSACRLAPITVIIDPDVSGDHIQIEATVHEAIDFFCDAYSIDDCDMWQLGLTVHIRASHWDCRVDPKTGKEKCYAGLYQAGRVDRVSVAWFDGPEGNAIWHELLHRKLYKDGKEWQGHPGWFVEEWVALQRLWTSTR